MIFGDALHQSLQTTEADLVLPVLRCGLSFELAPYEVARTVVLLFEGTVLEDLDDDGVRGAAAEADSAPLGRLDLDLGAGRGDRVVSGV